MRYVLDIAYDGTRYAGWQRQQNAHTVQAELEDALHTLLRCPVEVVGAGRTDTGVHARQLIVHFDVAETLPDGFLHHINGILPYDVAVKSLMKAKNEAFHARFDAERRSYQYQIVLRKTPHLHSHALWVRQELNWDKILIASELLLHYQDFAAFCKARGNQHTTLCQLFESSWELSASMATYHITANRFLRGMVRAIVGTLIEVGRHKINLSQFKQIIESRDRSQAGPNIAAKGLSLVHVGYPDACWTVIESL